MVRRKCPRFKYNTQMHKLNFYRFFLYQALLHPYFFNEPLPCPEHKMPKPSKDHRQTLIPKQTEVIESIEKNFSHLYQILDETL